ncbi:MAG: 50S ribosomal protein L22, partial [Lentisphaerae bacterium]
GKRASEALAILQFCPRKAAFLIGKTLKSAIANAVQTGADADALIVKRSVIGEGPTMRRIQYKSRGRAGRIRKRSSHIEIVVSDI